MVNLTSLSVNVKSILEGSAPWTLSNALKVSVLLIVSKSSAIAAKISEVSSSSIKWGLVSPESLRFVSEYWGVEDETGWEDIQPLKSIYKLYNYNIVII